MIDTIQSERQTTMSSASVLSPVQQQLKQATELDKSKVIFYVEKEADKIAIETNANNNEDMPMLYQNFAIKNNSPQRSLIYKIKTTAPLNYVVKPNSGIIEPNQTERVTITFITQSVSSHHLNA